MRNYSIPRQARDGEQNRTILAVVVIILLITTAVEAKYSGGTGEPSDSYRIATAEDLDDIGNHMGDHNKHFILVNDVNLAEYAGTQFNIIGADWLPAFTGVFDGNNHKVWNFTWSSTNKSSIGLFWHLGSGGQIKNLGMEKVDVNCVNGDYVGGLVVYNDHGMIIDCYSTGSIRGDASVGGLVGCNCGTIINCYSMDSVSGDYSVGGLVGSNECSSTLTNCYSTGSVSGNYSVGGLVGDNFGGSITNCYSTDSVLGCCDVGGLAGYNSSTITNCYSTGSVSGSANIGGIVGRGEGVIVNSFWDVETSGCSTSAGGTGKTTTEMKTANTYFGWNGCGEIWTLDEGNDYPRLAWEGKPGQPLPKQELSDFLEGSGTDTEPYLIYIAEQLNLIGLFPCEWDKDFMLAADINLADYSGTHFNIIGISNYPFTGVFDGNDRKIWNFTQTFDSIVYVSLFGCVGSSGQIKNLGLENVNVNGANAYCVGGLVGRNQGKITRCYSTGIISEGGTVGGLVGLNYYYGTITDCYSIGSVLGNYSVGGLVGFNYGGMISGCYSTGSVSGSSYVGGLVGRNSGTITNSYSKMNVFGEDYVGGLSGYNDSHIARCYSAGNVSGTQFVGGLLGYNFRGGTASSFWDIETSGEPNSAGGTGKTTAEMKTMSTFTDAGWDFVETWGIGENQTYPFLLTDPAGDSNHDKKVDFADLAILASHWLEER